MQVSDVSCCSGADNLDVSLAMVKIKQSGLFLFSGRLLYCSSGSRESDRRRWPAARSDDVGDPATHLADVAQAPAEFLRQNSRTSTTASTCRSRRYYSRESCSSNLSACGRAVLAPGGCRLGRSRNMAITPCSRWAPSRSCCATGGSDDQGLLQRLSASRESHCTQRPWQRCAVHLRVSRLAVPLQRAVEGHLRRAQLRAGTRRAPSWPQRSPLRGSRRHHLRQHGWACAAVLQALAALRMSAMRRASPEHSFTATTPSISASRPIRPGLMSVPLALGLL